ncbi:hypothetical protein FQA39_LY15792 [Lamprigera yunnana]|nr:hypothetical protein FQA39_LY15792 [Lamprigera yunnana]
MYSCNCLNVIIESEIHDFQHVNLDTLNLSDAEKQDIFFKQDVKQVGKLNRINKEHSGLVISRTIGNWIIYQCLNCDVHTHAIHRDRGAACVLISALLLGEQLIMAVRNNELFSNIFNILVIPMNENCMEQHNENLPPDVQLALGGLKQKVTELLSSETLATEERVRLFTEQQYRALEKYRESVHKEHKIFARIIMEKRYHQAGLSENYSMPSPHNTRLVIDNVSVTVNSNTSSDKSKTKLITKMKNNTRATLRQMSTPVSYGKSIDSEGLFQLEEMDEPHQTSITEPDDSDSEDPTKTEAAHLMRSKNQQSNIAKSLPVTIPAFLTTFRNRTIDDDQDDIMLQDKGDHPSDIAASIKALAKSVHAILFPLESSYSAIKRSTPAWNRALRVHITGFATKIEERVAEELGVTGLTIDPDACNLLYKHFGDGIDSGNIRAVTEHWESLLPVQALRLRLTVQQSAGTGLTALHVCGRAMNTFRDFKWDRVMEFYSDEWSNLQEAIRAVGDDVWYGFNHDLGVVRSTKYRNIAYVAKELLVKINGEDSLTRYGGWTRRARFQAGVDLLIAEYEDSKGNRMAGRPDNYVS